MSDVTDIRAGEARICMECGKQFGLGHARMVPFDDDGVTRELPVCPRCLSPKHDRFAPSQHQDIIVSLPEKYEQHALEDVARELFNRVGRLTGWREPKVQLWFQQANPLLGNVPPEWMILNGKADRLDHFVKNAEFFKTEYKVGQ